jgi:ectoine hydroxylase-related dioxygenase (phytanoyl-CoA dioxygenase family)
MTADYPYKLDPTTSQSFQNNGFVVTPDVLSPAELENYGRACDDEVARRTAGDTRKLEDKTRYEQSFVQCMRLWETAPKLAELTCHTHLAGIAVQLLGVTGVRLWQDQALYKEAGGAETTPHQDQTFWPIGEEPLVSAWIPFDDVTIENGAMAYVPGSHKAGSLPVVDITHTSEPYDILSDPKLNGEMPKSVEVKAGSVIWHHGMTVHQAAANTQANTRRVFTVVYIGDQARRHKDWPAYPLDRDGVGLGEIIQGVGMPQLWPPPETTPQPPPALGEQTGPQYEVRS